MSKSPTAKEMLKNYLSTESHPDGGVYSDYFDVVISKPPSQRLIAAIESHTQAHTDGLRAALSGIVEAWEALPEGHYTPKEIQKWIVKEMHPSIVKAREVLK